MWSLTLFILLVKKNESCSQMTGGRLRFAGWVVVNHIIDGFKEDPGVVFLQIIAGEMGGLGLLHSFFFDK